MSKLKLSKAAEEHISQDISIINEEDEDGDELNEETSSFAQGRNGSTRGSNQEDHIISKKETKAVFHHKLAVGLVMFASAMSVALTIYFYIARTENDSFEKEFRDNAHKVLDAIGSSFDKTLGYYDGVALTLVSYARTTNQSWPFVTLPDFAVKMSKIVPFTDAMNLNVAPLVTPDQRQQWETYTMHNDGWLNEAMVVQDASDTYYGPIVYNGTTNHVIHGDYKDIEANVSRRMAPTWQNFPVIPEVAYTYNWDWLSISFPQGYLSCLDGQKAVVSVPYMIPDEGNEVAELETQFWADYYAGYLMPGEESREPVSDLLYPIVDIVEQVSLATATADKNQSNHKVVGMLAASMYWREVIRDILPDGSRGLRIVFSCNCSNSFTYEIDGPEAVYKGVGDHHEKEYDGYATVAKLYDLLHSNNSAYTGIPMHKEYCPITLTLYPSDLMKSDFTTPNRYIFAVAAVFIFAFTSVVFCLYDLKVEKRQKKVMKKAIRSTEIVSSLFPSEVRDRLYPGHDEGTGKHHGDGHIAQLYPGTTVLFADIAGFTAWSSVRQASQVFHLLETLYAGFDEIAKRRGVFKVETIGDCYVAVVGLPSPRKNHAVVMARFADDCRNKMSELTWDLEETLGPGTGELALRIGLNSGPTTAGVLRGEKSRFQLFGDTVNTAARMESNGERNKIQVSEKTAELLRVAGKGHWLTAREEVVNAKGKGMMQTFWCNPKPESNSDTSSREAKEEICSVPKAPAARALILEKRQRLVDWNVDLFTGLLNEVVAQRASNTEHSPIHHGFLRCKDIQRMPRDEVADVLDLSNPIVPKAYVLDVSISPTVLAQLRNLISAVAKLYPDNPFHNFDHASHVVMSTKKLLDRMKCCVTEIQPEGWGRSSISQGLVLDALLSFSIVFGALVHDADHPGISNNHMIERKDGLAVIYEGKSVAEQNSIEVAWRLIMKPKYADLRGCLFRTDAELCQFRQILVHVVIGTDLFDKEPKSAREMRWVNSINNIQERLDPEQVDNWNHRLTIITELIVQASDVSHTMQHFTIYQKWNMNLLTEMYDAYKNGITTKDPTEGWYEGELWFFDNYVIPLARKLSQCGVFGVSCDEFLDYATDNRLEWAQKGQDIVREAVNVLKMRSARSKPCGNRERSAL